ncbi:MAG: tRNA (adenosine(37)-N6)-dimethylallyltransferase MiaA [Bacteroidota bacterium]
MKTRLILAVVGPTASGKTPLSLLLAELLNGEIISADSRQIYKHLDIGTAKPSLDDRKRVQHHFVDILDPGTGYNAGQFGEEVKSVFRGVTDRDKVPILVGGSGLYVKAAIDGIFDGPGKDPEIRGRIEDQLRADGLDALLGELRNVDPDTLMKMKEITPRRVIRALEVFYSTGKPISKFHAEQNPITEFQAIQVCLAWDRRELYARINSRVDAMIAAGLVDEVRNLKQLGYSRQLNALNTVGYKEVFDHLEGITDGQTMVELIKRNTRRFAKRQVTWFGADKRIHKFPISGERDIVALSKKIAELYRRAAKE